MDKVTAKESKVDVEVPRQHGYRGRVRSGCLTCRSRKIRCDEMRPTCNNCTKFAKRPCVYKPRKVQQPQASATASSPEHGAHVSGTRRSPGRDSFSQIIPSPISQDPNSVLAETFRSHGSEKTSWGAIHDEFHPPNEISFAEDDIEFDATLPSTLISRDIGLTTTMDLLTAGEIPLQLSFSFFIEEVECPSITPYDCVNWQHMKLAVVQLGMSTTAVASAIIALSTLYKAQLYNLPLSKASALYQSSKSAYEKLLKDETQPFGTILVVVFLLCLFQFIHYETDPIFREPSEDLLKRLQLWTQNGSSHSELEGRIMIWLRLLRAATMRGGGGMGLIADNICNLFPPFTPGMPGIKSPSNHPSDTSTQLFQMLSASIFEFYFQVQMISGEIARLTHYHRSRSTGADQEEVVRQTTLIKSRLLVLWENRSTTQRQTPSGLRAHLAPKIADSIISLIGICSAAYRAEFVEIDRVLGDPVSESTDSKQAMRQIREMVDGDWNAYDEGKLNSGYLRPLFLYAIECMDADENQWAVERLSRIKNPICRSDFLAAFGKALSDAQLRKERRVTSKYFCIWYFGVPPPFM